MTGALVLAGPPRPDLAGGVDAAADRLLALTGGAFERRLDPDSDAPVAVGFSGGGDSLALLLAARAWTRAAGRRLLALTVDHGLQPQSGAWTRSALATARSLGVESLALAWHGDKPADGLPARARRARHALLAEAARAAGARVILLGHTRDDLMESAQMRAEGSSPGDPREWAPSPVWPEGRGVFLLRPLLGAGRAELRALLSGTGLDWIEDPANDDPAFARARARAAPSSAAVAREAAPGVADASALARAAQVDDFGRIAIAREALLGASPRAARRFLAAACVCAGGGESLPRRRRVEALHARVMSGERFTAALAGARVEAGEQLEVFREAGAPLRRTPGVWDGRFAISGLEPGAEVRALRGLASRLPPAERRRLGEIPASARPGLPAIVQGDGESVTCPILAQGSEASARSLVGRRLGAACDVFAREQEVRTGPDGEPAEGALS